MEGIFKQAFVSRIKKVWSNIQPRHRGTAGMLGGMGVGGVGGYAMPVSDSAVQTRQKYINKNIDNRLRTATKGMKDPKHMAKIKARLEKERKSRLKGVKGNIRKDRAIAGLSLGGLAGGIAGTTSGVREINRRYRQQWDDFGKQWEQRWRGSGGSGRSGGYGRSGGGGARSSNATGGFGGFDEAKSFMGVGNETTKAEVKKKIRNMQAKAHPDRGGSTEAAQKANDFAEQIYKSDWFNKLAFRQGFEKVALTLGQAGIVAGLTGAMHYGASKRRKQNAKQQKLEAFAKTAGFFDIFGSKKEEKPVKKPKMNENLAKTIMPQFMAHEKQRVQDIKSGKSVSEMGSEADQNFINAVSALEMHTGIDNTDIYNYMYKHHGLD